MLASGGGNATSAGITMQASVAASISVQIIRGVSLDPRLGLGAAKPVSIRLETEVPVDDILVETDKGRMGLRSGEEFSSQRSDTHD